MIHHISSALESRGDMTYTTVPESLLCTLDIPVGHVGNETGGVVCFVLLFCHCPDLGF